MNDRAPALTRALLRAYAQLSLLLPRSFRERFGKELLSDFAELMGDAYATGGGPAVLFRGTGALVDLALRIPRERRVARQRSHPHTTTLQRLDDDMRTLLTDLRLAIRSLARQPGFSATAITTLALGLGATLTIFTLVYAILIQPLPYPDSDRIVVVRHHAPGLDLPDLNNSDGTIRFYRANGDPIFSSFAPYDVGARNLMQADTPERAPVLYASAEFWDVLRVRPILGRAFNVEETAEGAAPVALLTHGTWTRQFGRDPGVVGRTIDVEGVATEVIGVLPPGFDFDVEGLAMVVPLYVDPNGEFGAFGTDVVARLQHGVSLEDANTILAQLQERLPEFFGEDVLDATFMEAAGWSASLETLRDTLISGTRTALWVVLGSVLFLLLIACANVANLFLVRAEGGRKPAAVRMALGAGDWRIARGVLSETLVLTLAGSAVGVAMAWGALELVTSRGVADLPRLAEVHLGAATIAVAAALAVVTAALLAVLPILRFRATNLTEGLRSEGRTSTSGRESTWSRDLLVSFQLAAALVLVVGSGLLFRSFDRLQAVDPGFDMEGVTIAGLSRRTDEDPAAALAAHRVLMDRLTGLPGVERVALTSGFPFIEGSSNGGSFYIESRPRADDELPPVAMNKSVTEGYFEALGMPVLEGRSLRAGDGDDGRPVVWVNQTLANRFLDGQAIGERIRDSEDGEWAEIVGVVGDVREFGLSTDVRPVIYVPAALFDWGPHLGLARIVLVIQGRSEARDLAGPLRDAVAELDPASPVLSVRSLAEGVAESLAQRRYTMIIVLLAGTVALLLGAIGVFGVISYVVGQRGREIGLRMALGAERGDVERMFILKGARVAGFGIVLGLVGAAVLSRSLQAALFEISATDPVTFVAAPLLLAAVALLATWLPARRAARLDPMAALRAE